ncbi:MAG: T9SS type A sorting domain-containing protein [Saprospiraceae bacterium]
MKSIYTTLIFILLYLPLVSQISINNSSFPGEGTVLKKFSLTNTTNVNAGPAGENKLWDYNDLNGGTPSIEKYLQKSMGQYASTFADANVLIVNSNDPGDETYARILNSRIEVVGFSGQNPFFGGDLAISYSKRPMLRRAPMFYETSAFSQGSFNLGFSTDILPDSLLASLPIKPDSIRVSTSTIKNDTIDAWGKLKLKNKEFDVLREKSVVFTSNKLEVKLPLIGWLDVSTLLGGMGGFDGFGNDTTFIYNFFTNTRKDILVSINIDTDNKVFLVEYADIDNTINTFDLSLNSDNLLYPNPVSNIFYFENYSLRSGEYVAKIVDIQGKIIQEQNVHIVEELPLQYDTSALANGNYFLMLNAHLGSQSIRAPFTVQR